VPLRGTALDLNTAQFGTARSVVLRVIRQQIRDTCPPADVRQVWKPADHMTGGNGRIWSLSARDLIAVQQRLGPAKPGSDEGGAAGERPAQA